MRLTILMMNAAQWYQGAEAEVLACIGRQRQPTELKADLLVIIDSGRVGKASGLLSKLLSISHLLRT